MDGCDEPVPIMPDIENYEPSHVVCIREICPEFYKILPSCCFNDFDPGGNVCLCLLVIFKRYPEISILKREITWRSIW
jgi:hypothetical protein